MVFSGVICSVVDCYGGWWRLSLLVAALTSDMASSFSASLIQARTP